MGVKGLWQLVLPIGRRISLESLEGQILAVDVSIWIIQLVKAMRDPESGKVQPAAHLKGVLRRLCRLRMYNIRPVFVFDGKMPEVKAMELASRRRRREQFAHVSQGAVQRLAKKLLQETLLKQRISTSASQQDGAFAKGFNPGEQHEDASPVVDIEHEGTCDDVGSICNDVDTKESAVVALSAVESEENGNDWDDPAETEQEQLQRLGLYDSDENDDEENDMDMSFLASLPPSKRKDAIEKAQRRHRIRSRKEHMPAAGDPMAFSRVQVTNFLKSSKLNKNIRTALTVAAKQESSGGDVMSSDVTTRLELIREEQTRANGSQIDGRMLHKSSTDESSSEEEPEWEATPVAGKSKAVIDDDSDQEFTTRVREVADEEGEVDEPGRNNRVNQTAGTSGDHVDGRSRQFGSRNQVHDLDTARDCDSEDGGGGFIRSFEETTALRQRSYSGEHYGYTVHDEIPAKGGSCQGAACLTTERMTSPDTKINQETKDRQLAMALQEAEDAKAAASLSDVLETPLQAHACNKSATSSRSCYDEDVEWEEAGGVDLVHSVRIETESKSLEKDRLFALALQKAEDSEAANSLSNEFTENRPDLPLQVRLADQKDSIPAADTEEEDDDDDEDVGWEEGENILDDERPLIGAEKSKSVEVATRDDIDWEEDVTAYSDRDDFNGECAAKRQKREHHGDETAAALERAQKEASKLADWAGRVFRRTMKESRKLKESAVRNSPRLQSASEELPSSDSPSHVLAHADAVELGSPAVYVELSAISPSRASQASSYNGVVNKMYTDKEIDEAMNLTENNDRAWTEERNRRERDMDSVTDEMKLEVMQLLRLFGVPFFEAPAEAESQCVELERLGLVHGVITEDSDALVFGGKTIYKNIFEDQKYAEVYKAVDAEREMGLGRSQMVALAMLLGGDYTEGVKGVGIVNAMEILDAFDFSTSAIEGLRMFKEWMDGIDLSDTIDLNQMRGMKAGIHDFHTKHKSARSRWVAPDGFPSESILKAYEQPVVDTSRDRFTWGTPDAVGLIMFCHQNMGWSTEETKALLDPVLNQMNGLRQTRLDAFIPMRYEDSIKFANVKSKRLRNVLQKKKTCSRVNEEE